MTDQNEGRPPDESGPERNDFDRKDHTNPCVKAALAYAKHGLRGIPLWWPENGGCACRDGSSCNSPGKHPIHLGWQNKATTDPEIIRGWFEDYPHANVGIVGGWESGRGRRAMERRPRVPGRA